MVSFRVDVFGGQKASPPPVHAHVSDCAQEFHPETDGVQLLEGTQNSSSYTHLNTKSLIILEHLRHRAV